MQANIHVIEDTTNPNDCSSTKIRAARRRGDSIKYLVADAVNDYIEQNHLYRESCATSAPTGAQHVIGTIAHHIPPDVQRR